ncbi:MAG TPA: RidA family protein [Blastocatellia bacterium]|nr:RidA family protein [Blastocatellia bacterium]
MKIDFINPKELAAPSGYNHGVAVTGGSLLFVSGQIGWDNQSRMVSDKFVDQFALALENVVAVVREAGGEAQSIVRLLIFVTDKSEYLDNLKAVGAAYRKVMGKHFPAMALVEVKALVEDLAKVEIEAIAVIDAETK